MRKWIIPAMVINAAIVAALPAPTVFYVANVLLHIVLGALGAGLLAWRWRRSARVAPLAVGGALGVYLIFAGATHSHLPAVEAHLALGIVGLAMLFPRWIPGLVALTFLAAALRAHPKQDRIVNPTRVPASMAEEGAGPASPFWPSSSGTNTGTKIPADFFMDSKLCGNCHREIYEQWQSSMHHMASFNNVFYRATIEHMQDLSGTQGSKWCAGCHDHAVFFNGRFERPIREQVDTPEAQNGLGCVSCHSISHVGSTMGNGDFLINYPPLHKIMASPNPWVRRFDSFLIYLNPQPHRMTFMRAFMRVDSPEYCSACHKVHLDQPVNHYRWLRGFNEYDNWQASGVSGQGARSFYYPAQSSTCTDCHMSLTASNDPASRDGKIHSHRFAAANTAVPAVNHDSAQLSATENFLQSGFITVDLFAASPAETRSGEPQMLRRASDAPRVNSTFAVGEEAESAGPAFLREVGKIAAPIDAPGVRFRPGSSVRIDAVVRTRKIGHFFPAGTVDGYDVWLEFQARDARGKVIAWSGWLEDGDRGPVDSSAHFYRSFQLDADGNPINKRNAWQTRSVLYVHLIPPGAADTVHFRLAIPRDAVSPITLNARLNYRKFSDSYTKFVFGGTPGPGHADVHADSRVYLIDESKVPLLPVVTLAEATSKIQLGEPAWRPVVRKQDRERWNDWGIGLLLQGDVKGAEYAFREVTQAEPGYADGWLNIGRALIQEGETEAARSFVEKALALKPDLARAHFFLAVIRKTAGDYDGALANLKETARQYPRDRVTLEQIARVLFLKRDYRAAIEPLKKALAVDPEDLAAHYNLMLVYRGLARNDDAAREEKLFLRFKADESAQALTAKPRMLSPEDNNERQPIHDHDTDYIPGRFRAPAPAGSAFAPAASH